MNQKKTREIFFLLYIFKILPIHIIQFDDFTMLFTSIEDKTIGLNNILKCIKKPFEIEGNHEFAVDI